jgi:hypothetical protein
MRTAAVKSLRRHGYAQGLLADGLAERGGDVIRFQERIILQNLRVGRAGGNEIQHIANAQSVAAYAWTSATFPRLHGDTIKKVHKIGKLSAGHLIRKPFRTSRSLPIWELGGEFRFELRGLVGFALFFEHADVFVNCERLEVGVFVEIDHVEVISGRLAEVVFLDVEIAGDDAEVGRCAALGTESEGFVG